MTRANRTSDAARHWTGETGTETPDDLPTALVEPMRAGATAIHAFVATSQDLARFYNERLRKDFAYLSAFGSCRSPADMAVLWWRMASETAHDYADQVDRVMALSLDGTQDAAGEGAE